MREAAGSGETFRALVNGASDGGQKALVPAKALAKCQNEILSVHVSYAGMMHSTWRLTIRCRRGVGLGAGNGYRGTSGKTFGQRTFGLWRSGS